MQHTEIECRVLNVDKDDLVAKLTALGAEDFGEKLVKEVILGDADNTWRKNGRVLRLRQTGEKTELAYKEHTADAVDGALEIEFEVEDYNKAVSLLEHIGFTVHRHQEKKRHKLKLDGVTLDIDTWPSVPAYVELEAKSEEELKSMIEKIGYKWEDAVFKNAAKVIEEYYNIPVRDLTWFTFDRVEK